MIEDSIFVMLVVIRRTFLFRLAFLYVELSKRLVIYNVSLDEILKLSD